MPKKTAHPKLRTYVKKGANGQRWVSYWYDNRGSGKPDVPLGSDYDKALAKWDEIHHARKRVSGTIEEALKRWEAEVLPTYESAETKRGYTKSLRQIRPVFGPQPWSAIKLPQLKAYLRNRTAKTQANRELSLLMRSTSTAEMPRSRSCRRRGAGSATGERSTPRTRSSSKRLR